MTDETNVLLLAGTDADESPAAIAANNGLIPAGATSANIHELVTMLQRNSVESAHVGSWNGQAGDFVLRGNGALHPYDAFTNDANHAFAVRPSKD
ncbi:hypothetical protein ACIA8O_37230 [Kitasatospora sp. NPDC051853]|uniref:hypothetical protein n=1 Tax=Kitasatospora sp. NPDC051853 TaxID=3364058 RepID=UPI0037ACBFAC